MGQVDRLLVHLVAGRLERPQDLLDCLEWTSTSNPRWEETETAYREQFTRYITGAGIVRHRLFPTDQLSDVEKSIAADDSCVRALMFLMYACGTQQLPRAGSKITVSEMQFI